MAGLFGQKIRDFMQSEQGGDYFTAMSRGENFGSAIGTSNEKMKERMMLEAAQKRQQGIDGMNMQHKQAQINNLNRPVPPMETFSQGVNPGTGLPTQMSNVSGKMTDYARPPVAPQQKNPFMWTEQNADGSTQQYANTPQGKVAVGSSTQTKTEIAQDAYREEMRQGMPDARFQMDTAFAEATETTSLIDGMLNNQVGLDRSIGTADDFFPSWNDDVRAFDADKAQLGSKLTLDTLVNLKRAGGTLGAVNATEFETLKTAGTNLAKITNEAQYRTELLRIRNKIASMTSRIQEAYVAKYSGVDNYQGKWGVGTRSMPGYQNTNPNAKSGTNGMKK